MCAVPRQVRAVHACAVLLNAGADRAEQSMKRFWKDVHLAFETPSNGDDEHFVVQLDPLSYKHLTLPTTPYV